ncbi:MAG: DUF4041 domain-containing protein, partial [Epsilonproteobacteria bacterium]|nr:DUF4041 domain-containing protein [Campylobacterota bacterium]
TKIRGIPLFPKQEEIVNTIIKTPSRWVALNASRQFSKSTIIEQILLYYCLNEKKSKSLYITPKYALSKIVMDRVYTNLVDARVVKVFNKSDNHIQFVNGSDIYFRSATNPDTIRGLSANYVYIDEAAFISDEACDFLIEKVTPASYTRTLERIEKLANDIEKLSLTLECGFNIDYIKLKFEECTLQYQYKLKKQEEQDEQIAIKEQMREEQKAIQEYERAIRDAEKEERLYTSLLEKAKIELEKASESEKAIMAARVSQLEVDLAEALARGERAKSMAEQTKKGYIYVISNIGSFGEDVYKIGMTRRLDPMDRVRELSNASVPFPFDVHAMIYYEDAPKLESQLHKEFNNNRVNAVNLRKEFFNVELEKIRDTVEKITDNEADFKMTVLAEQYNETLRLISRASQVTL